MTETSQYKKNYLSDVVFRIDYPLVIDMVKKAPDLFQKAIQADFPSLEPIELSGFELKKDGDAVSTKSSSKIVWKFSNREKTRIVELEPEALTINFKKYTNFDEFKTVVSKMLDALVSVYPSTLVNRLGLRYINQISLKEDDLFDWSNYINKTLIGMIPFEEDSKKVRRVMHTSVIYVDEDVRLHFRSGIFNSDFPNKLMNKEFILDFDCSTRVSFDLEKAVVLEKIGKYNEIITEYFEKSITEKFRNHLNS